MEIIDFISIKFRYILLLLLYIENETMSVRRSPENSSRLAIESVQCSICNDTNAEIDFVETPCQHRFHRTCVTSWLLQNETCPNCRQPCLSSQLNDSTRRAQDTTLEVPRVQNGSNPNSRTGAVPRSRPNTRPTTRSTATISNNRPSTSSQPQRSPRAGGSQRTTSISEEEIFVCFGTPEVLVSDNGTQFKSQDFAAFISKHGIQHIFTGAYSPQSNAAERVNRSINAALRSYIRSDQRLWDLYIRKN
ncbi:KIAA1133 protein [Wolbachia endosymbiont of Drosophila ananassae]|nr:KIAA1133 protein [Wolbachia endosymbiont of Drosophila ananassae]